METDQSQWELVEDTYRIESEAIRKAYRAIDPKQFSKAVDLLLHAPRIAASGCGHSGYACMHFVQLLCCIERPARYLYPSEAIHGGIGFLLSGDAMILCSRGGLTRELLEIEETCRKKNVHIIAVTENMGSPLAKRAEIVLKLAVTREVDKFDIQGTTSFAVANVLFDALQNALIERVGFTQAQYAVDHPGGAVGVRLSASARFTNPTD